MERDDAKRRVLEATDVVRLIGEHVALRPRGRELVGLCPFHDDRSPSMYVSPTKQIYKCFSCGAGGDAFSFMMAYHKMTFPEALEHLAERENIKLPKRGGHGGGGGGGDAGDGSGDSASPRQQIMQANERAGRFFRQIYRDPEQGRIAREYVAARGISDQMVETFGIGCSPDRWDGLSAEVQRQRWDVQGFEAAGLIAARSGGGQGHYDRLRHRLTFPICDALGRAIAFGGRQLPGGTLGDKSDAKYLNSPESAAFNKSATLFGLHLAQQAIIASRTAVIVEGYTDVIAAHQAGRANAVATLGTALTAEHARVLRRYCDRVILVFDADEAGQKAAERALGVFFAENVDVHIAVLGEGMDPADLLAKDDGLTRWDAAMGTATDALRFQFDRVAAAVGNADSMAGRQRIIDDYLRTLVNHGLTQLEPGRKGLVIAHLADLLHLGTGEVDAWVRRLSKRTRRPMPADAEAEPGEVELTPPGDGRHRQAAQVMAERHIVGCLLNDPALFHEEMPDGRPLDEAFVPADFEDADARRVYDRVYEYLLENDRLSPAHLRDVFGEDEATLQLAIALQREVEQLSHDDPARQREMLTRCARTLQAYQAEQEYREQKAKIAGAAPGDGPAGAGVETSTDNASAGGGALRRLELAKAHRNAHPSAVARPGAAR